MIIRIVKYTVISFGCFWMILLALCFTTAPFHLWYGMSMKKAGIHRPPDYIVVLGGGGMPSETGLMRTWYAARLANHFQDATVVVALPGDIHDSLSSVSQMKAELVTRGIAPERIIPEDSGTNTRSQSLQVFQMIRERDPRGIHSLVSKYPYKMLHSLKGQNPTTDFHSLVVVTSPDHLYRAVLTFTHAGFFFVDGLPAFDNAIESDISFRDSTLGGRTWFPDMGKNLTVRYRFWTQMHYEQLIIREYFALAYYWVKGWI